MKRVLALALLLYLLIYLLRVQQVGGIDSSYHENEATLFTPWRDQLTVNLDRILPFPQSVLLSGMLLGKAEKLPFGLKEDLKATSTIHLIVVSGQNLTILAGFLMSLVGWIGRKKTIALTLGVITLYSGLTGFEVPVTRAAIMAGLVYLAQILGKEGTSWWILVLTAGAMLLYNPNYLLNISFQLSFLATAGVVIVAPLLVCSLKKVPALLREDLAVTLAAQSLTLPVIAYNFNQLSLVGVLANMLVLWLMPLLMIVGFAVLTVSLVSLFLGQLLGIAVTVLLTYFIYIVEMLAAIPGAGLKVGDSVLLFWVGYYLLALALIIFLHLRQQFSESGDRDMI